MRLLRVGKVPEHFSSPLHLGLERGIFDKHNVKVELVDCPGGTGEMVRLLESGEIDIAIALTEGLVAVLAGNGGSDAFRIVGTYVDAPLTWAISAGRSSPVSSVDELRGARIGISRLGSGSHIMSYVLAHERGWLAPNGDADPFSFAELKDFRGLREGVNDQRADAFMWETFTTKPFHDSQELKRVGQITTPWPAFLVAARTKLVQEDADAVRRFIGGVTEACAIFTQECSSGMSQKFVAETYMQQPEDVEAWLRTVKYATNARQVSMRVLNDCVQALRRANLVVKPVDPHTLVAEQVAIACD